MLRGSDLALLKNQIHTVVRETASPAQKQYFDLAYGEGLAVPEVAKAVDITKEGVAATLNQLKIRILKQKPFLQTVDALKYKGAARILKLLAIQCNRDQEVHDDRDYSYTELFQNVCDIVDSEGTDIQKEVYDGFFVDGKSQVDLADGRDVIQPTIWKTIYGSYDISHRVHYGGIISKVGKELRKRNIPYCCHLIDPYGSLFQYVLGR